MDADAPLPPDPSEPLPDRIRHRFPIFERQIYINSCSQGALSDAVRAAYDAYLDDWDTHGAPWEYWVGRTEAARSAFAGLLGAEPDEIAVTTSVSAGLSAFASGLRFGADRPKVVLSDFEFPAVGQIWHAQEARGAEVVHVADDGAATIPMEHFDAAIDERTKIVSVTQVCYRNGSRIDVDGVVKLAHERGALVVLDAYQAVGALPIDVRALDVDVLVGGALKYLLGSAGLGFLYCRADLVETIAPTATGWFADESIFDMDIHDYSPSPTARRFQSGTPPVPSLYAGVAGVELMRAIGVADTHRHVQALNTALIEGVTELGGRVVTPLEESRRGPLVAIAAADEHALVAALAADGIVTSSRDGNLRVSAHCYNSADDIEAVVSALARHRRLLRT